MMSKKVRVFFRKKRPIVQPDQVFIYVGVPVKQIIGFAAIDRIEKIGLSDALRLSDDGCISEVELRRYIQKDDSVYAIYIRDTVIFRKSVLLESIKTEFGFNPPQSFSNVSDEFARRLRENGE